jgi:hypothetical protein
LVCFFFCETVEAPTFSLSSVSKRSFITLSLSSCYFLVFSGIVRVV